MRLENSAAGRVVKNLFVGETGGSMDMTQTQREANGLQEERIGESGTPDVATAVVAFSLSAASPDGG